MVYSVARLPGRGLSVGEVNDVEVGGKIAFQDDRAVEVVAMQRFAPALVQDEMRTAKLQVLLIDNNRVAFQIAAFLGIRGVGAILTTASLVTGQHRLDHPPIFAARREWYCHNSGRKEIHGC
jgi:hypothetical protein